MTIEINNHWKYQVWTLDDEQIFDFDAIGTNVVITPFGVVLPYVTIPKSPLPTKWSNEKQSCHAKLKCKIWVDHYKYVTNLTHSQT